MDNGIIINTHAFLNCRLVAVKETLKKLGGTHHEKLLQEKAQLETELAKWEPLMQKVRDYHTISTKPAI